MLPDGLKIVPYYDRTDLVNAAIWTVTKVLIEGVVLVVIVLFLFLGDLRSSLIVVATLIVTPLVTFLVMNEYDLSANLMSLGGLAIAIGMMVDGSVVVVENTFRHLAEAKESGESRNFVVLRAAVEVGTPVLFGVGIICLVFLPLMTLQGMEGKMFAPLAYVIAIAMFVSLVLSLTLSPVLCSYFLRGGAEHDTPLVRFVKVPYLRLLERALDNPHKVVFGGLVLLGASVAAFPLLGTSFIPEMKEGAIVPGINRVTNMSLEGVDRARSRGDAPRDGSAGGRDGGLAARPQREPDRSAAGERVDADRDGEARLGAAARLGPERRRRSDPREASGAAWRSDRNGATDLRPRRRDW